MIEWVYIQSKEYINHWFEEKKYHQKSITVAHFGYLTVHLASARKCINYVVVHTEH